MALIICCVLVGKSGLPSIIFMIVGGGTVGTLTAKNLEKDYKLKMVEINPECIQKLADELRNTMIINGDAHDVALLEKRIYKNMDAVIAVTNNSETNILTCLIAKKHGVKKTIALVENLNFIEISQNIGIDTIINKKLATASYIIRFTMKAEVISTKCLNGIDAEIFEFLVKAGSPITKKPIQKLKFPQAAIIGGIIRDNEGILPQETFRSRPETKWLFLPCQKLLTLWTGCLEINFTYFMQSPS
jgi:trk system potassium uptake protein